MLIGFNHILRGFVSKDADTRGVIVADLAGTTKTFEFPYDAKITGGKKSSGKADFELMFFSPLLVGPQGNPPKYPTLPPYGGTLHIALERRHRQASMLVQIDQLDIQAAYSAPDKPLE